MLKQKNFLSYYLCATLFFMWQTGNTLAAGNMPGLAKIADPVFVVHYLLAGLGLLSCGLLCDKIILLQDKRRLFAVVMAAAAGMLTLARLFTHDPTLYLALYFIGTFLGFGVNAVILGGLFVPIGQSYKPLGFGLAFATATLLRFPIDLLTATNNSGHAAYIIFSSAALFLLTGLFFSKPICTDFAETDDELREREQLDIDKSGNLVWLAVACGVAVYILFGIFDNLISGSPLFENATLYLRLAQILSSAAVGFICLRFGYYTAVIASISFLGIGTLTHLFAWSGAAGLICSLSMIIGFNLFTVPLRSIFAEIARREKYPHTVAAFGFALYFFSQILGIPIAHLMRSMDKESGMALYTVLFMAVIPIIVLLFSALRHSHRTAPDTPTKPDKPDIWEKYKLSRREKEILELVLKGLLSREIAEILFVSESTVNWHVSNILKKTGVSNRAGLIEMNDANKKP